MTKMNDVSSRSHAIFTLVFTQVCSIFRIDVCKDNLNLCKLYCELIIILKFINLSGVINRVAIIGVL